MLGVATYAMQEDIFDPFQPHHLRRALLNQLFVALYLGSPYPPGLLVEKIDAACLIDLHRIKRA